MARSWDNTKAGVRRHAFRTWTACAVLAAYVYGWVYVPEALIWWQRTTTTAMQSACGLLPYPWNDRAEATLGNFGLWVQITLAVVLFRITIWLVMSALRGLWSVGDRRRERLRRSTAGDAPGGLTRQ